MTQESIITLLSAAVAVLAATVALLLWYVVHLKKWCKKKNQVIVHELEAQGRIFGLAASLGINRMDIDPNCPLTIRSRYKKIETEKK